MSRYVSIAIAGLALFVAFGGVSDAASVLVGSSDIKKNAVRSKHVKNNSLTGADIKESTLALPQGPQGPKGDPGAPATKLWAVVDNAHTGVVRGSGVTGFDEGSPDNGRVDIAFNRDLSACAYVVGVSDVGADHPGAPYGAARVEELQAANVLRVVTFNPNTAATLELPFHLVVFC